MRNELIRTSDAHSVFFERSFPKFLLLVCLQYILDRSKYENQLKRKKTVIHRLRTDIFKHLSMGISCYFKFGT